MGAVGSRKGFGDGKEFCKHKLQARISSLRAPTAEDSVTSFSDSTSTFLTSLNEEDGASRPVMHDAHNSREQQENDDVPAQTLEATNSDPAMQMCYACSKESSKFNVGLVLFGEADDKALTATVTKELEEIALALQRDRSITSALQKALLARGFQVTLQATQAHLLVASSTKADVPSVVLSLGQQKRSQEKKTAASMSLDEKTQDILEIGSSSLEGSVSRPPDILDIASSSLDDVTVFRSQDMVEVVSSSLDEVIVSKLLDQTETGSSSQDHTETGSISQDHTETGSSSQDHTETKSSSQDHTETRSSSQDHTETGSSSQDHTETGSSSQDENVSKVQDQEETSNDPIEIVTSSHDLKKTRSRSKDEIEGGSSSHDLKKTRSRSQDEIESGSSSHDLKKTRSRSKGKIEGGSSSHGLKKTRSRSTDEIETKYRLKKRRGSKDTVKQVHFSLDCNEASCRTNSVDSSKTSSAHNADWFVRAVWEDFRDRIRNVWNQYEADSALKSRAAAE